MVKEMRIQSLAEEATNLAGMGAAIESGLPWYSVNERDVPSTALGALDLVRA